MKQIILHYPLSCICIIAIWILCLIPIPETPLDNISFIDKWTHFVMYGGLCAVLWMEYGHRHLSIDKRKAIVWIVIAPIIMGGLIELAQAYCTSGVRNGDWLDWATDAVGVLIGQVIGIPLGLFLSRKNKER